MRLVQNLICGIIHATIILVINSAQPQLKQHKSLSTPHRQERLLHVPAP